MPIPSSSSRGVLGRIGGAQSVNQTASSAAQVSTSLPFVTASSVPPVGWLGVFNTGRYFCFVDNGTFLAPLSGYFRVRVLGGGGCGATINGTQKRATGGGGGGYALGVVWLTQGQAVSITVGKGGSWVADGQPGGAGGASAFGAYMTATGGAGGTCADSAALSAALGGVGSGGSLLNASGGKSGSIDGNLGTSATGGGGAGSQLGNGGDSGSISGNAGTGNAATGGAAAGAIASASISRGGHQASGGAGIAGSSTLQLGGFDLLSVAAAQHGNGTVNSSSAVFRFPGDAFGGGGGGPGYSNALTAGLGGTGAGGGGHMFATGGSYTAGAGGFFGGTGACTNVNSGITPKPGYGGGGGGVAGVNGGQSVGGDGLVVVEW